MVLNNYLHGGKFYRCQIWNYNVTAKHSGRRKIAILTIVRKLKMVAFRNDLHKLNR